MGIRSAILFFWAAGWMGQAAAQESSPRDTSPHATQFIPVDENVKLEVLDWGGAGRAVVLLAGLGSTAHVYDDFAPKLAAAGYHVWGITRRGYGNSSAPEFGYSADRLGDDVLAVIAALKLDRPVLAGNGIAGEELSSVGSRHPEKVAGLIYLDAAYSYAYYDRTRGDLFFDLLDLEKKLEQAYLSLTPASSPRFKKDLVEMRKELTQLQESNGLPEDPRLGPVVRRLLESNLPARFEKDVQEEEQKKPAQSAGLKSEPVKRTQERKKVYEDLLQTSLPGFEKDLREAEKEAPAGAPQTKPVKSSSGTADRARQAILQGRQKYTYLHLPVLAIYSLPHAGDDPHEAGDEEQAKALESGVRSARVVRLPHADRKVFSSNQADVLREMTAFLGGLP